MLRRSIATLLILTFLPIPGGSLTFGWESPFSPGVTAGDGSVTETGADSPKSVVRHETDADGEMPHNEDIIFESDSEISESELSENGESESIDFAGVFDRQDFSDSLNRMNVYLTVRGSNRFSNPNEVFRILRC